MYSMVKRMGLDMYLLMKREGVNHNGVLGCCNGGFPIGIKTQKEQIGYWRKAYSVNDAILNMVAPNAEDDNCVEFPISYEQVERLLDIIDTNLTNYKLDSNELEDWRDAKEFFGKAKKLIEEDKSVSIFYMIWY